MMIKIRVIPGAKKNIIKAENGNIRVYVTAPAIDGKANKSAIVALAKYFFVKKRQVNIIKGLKSRDKIVNITD